MALQEIVGLGGGQDELSSIDWDEFNDPADFMGRGAAEDARNAAQMQADAIRESSQLKAAGQERGLQAMLEQLGITRESFAPFLAAGQGALPELQEGFQPQRGSTVGGLEDILAEIMGGESFGALRDERRRGIEGQLASSGLRRSGTAIEQAANLPTDLAFQIENMMFGRGQGDEIARIQGLQQLTNMGLSAAGTSGGQGGSLTDKISQQFGSMAGTQGGGITGAAEAMASGIFGANQAEAQGKSNLLSAAGMFFSDPKLKKNIKKIGEIGPLNLVEWEWVDELGDSFVKSFPTMGYLSTQVKEFFPQFVGEFAGYDVIDYASVNKELVSWG